MASLNAADMTRPELEALLRWYVAMGVDMAVQEAPHDRFADFATAMAARRAASAQPQPAPAAASLPSGKAALPGRSAPAPMRPVAIAASAEEAIQEARARAHAALTLDELRANMEGFDGCALKRTASQLVFADGNPKARIMLLGDAPSGDDDREGRPFVGAPGRLLDRMLGSIGLDREQVYLANIVPWRPPGNRKPTEQEIAICLPFARRQIELVDPDILVCLGDWCSQALLGVKEGIMRARGKAYEYPVSEGRNIRAFVMLNPGFLMKQPRHKKPAWLDLRSLRKAMG